MAALTFLQATQAQAGSATSKTTQFPSLCTIGSYLLALVQVSVSSGMTIASVSDTVNTWSQIGTAITSGGYTAALFQCASNTSHTALQVTGNTTGGSAGFIAVTVYEFTGQASGTPLDAFVTGTGSTSSHVAIVPAVTSMQTNEEIIAIGFTAGQTAGYTSANGWTPVVYTSNPSFVSEGGYISQANPGTYGDSVTLGTNSAYGFFTLAVMSTTSQPVGGGNNGNGLLNLLGVN